MAFRFRMVLMSSPCCHVQDIDGPRIQIEVRSVGLVAVALSVSANGPSGSAERSRFKIELPP